MLCEHCNQNEATVSLHMHINGHGRSLRLCPQCARALGGQFFTPISPMPWPLNGPVAPETAHAFVRPPAARPEISGEVDSGLSRRRELSALQSRLDTALQQENYEEAILIRDQIKGLSNAL